MKRPTTHARADGAKLIAAILSEPGDLAHRLVYGDWLLERDDPRGELIALQRKGEATTADDRRRIAALVDKHGAGWIAPLDRVVRGPELKLGFLSRCASVRFRSKAERAELLEHPLWATLEELGFDKDGELATSPALTSLRRVSTTLTGLAQMARAKHALSVEDVGFYIHLPGRPGSLGEIAGPEHLLENEDPDWAASSRVGSLRRVRTLRFDAYDPDGLCDPDHYAWLTSSALVAQLRELELERCTKRWVPVGRWVPVWRRLPKLERLVFTFSSWEGQPSGVGHAQRLILTRSGAKSAEVGLELPNREKELVPKVFKRVMKASLADVPSSLSKRVTVRLLGKAKTKKEVETTRSTVEAVLREHFETVQFV